MLGFASSNLSTKMKMVSLAPRFFMYILVLLLLQCGVSMAQQAYLDNKQLDCDQNFSVNEGYVCNSPISSCLSYLTFRSNSPYTSPLQIADLLAADASQIAQINNVPAQHSFPPNALVLVPINCSCFAGKYYQHNASYVLKSDDENYFTMANNTYGGLTTCQALRSQKPYYYRGLEVGMRISVPLRCACPTPNQTATGINYLLSYLITWEDYVEAIGEAFGSVDYQTILAANELSTDLIFPFTTLLVPLKTHPIYITNATGSSPPPSSPYLPTAPLKKTTSSSHKWVFIGVGVGAALLALAFLCGFPVWLFHFRGSQKRNPILSQARARKPVESDVIQYGSEMFAVYKFEDLWKATGSFGEENRVKGSVYRGLLNGNYAAVKVLKGDMSGEIDVLKQINHSNIIRLSGFCAHEGNTYLVYEYAENGSRADWLHLRHDKTCATKLGWKQRVQIAHNISTALSYLHNYTNPPCVHKNLKSSNILLDANFRARVANFGLARTLENEDGLQLTRHVVGTHGYMAPEYIENGLITPKLDVFAFGVVMLELLSGKEATGTGGRKKNGEEEMLSGIINQVLEDQNVREQLRHFLDPCLKNEYPLDLAYSMAQLAKSCVAHDPNSRPDMLEVSVVLSKILSSSLDWDPSDELECSRSLSHS